MVRVAESLKDSITLSATDTFTEEELLITEVNLNKRKCMLIDQINVEVLNDKAVDTDELLFQLTSSEEGEAVNISDKDLIFKTHIRYDGTPLGEDMVRRYVFDPPIPYIKEKMWIGASSVGDAAGTYTFHFEILHHYGFLNRSQVDRIISRKF